MEKIRDYTDILPQHGIKVTQIDTLRRTFTIDGYGYGFKEGTRVRIQFQGNPMLLYVDEIWYADPNNQYEWGANAHAVEDETNLVLDPKLVKKVARLIMDEIWSTPENAERAASSILRAGQFIPNEE